MTDWSKAGLMITDDEADVLVQEALRIDPIQTRKASGTSNVISLDEARCQRGDRHGPHSGS